MLRLRVGSHPKDEEKGSSGLRARRIEIDRDLNLCIRVFISVVITFASS